MPPSGGRAWPFWPSRPPSCKALLALPWSIATSGGRCLPKPTTCIAAIWHPGILSAKEGQQRELPALCHGIPNHLQKLRRPRCTTHAGPMGSRSTKVKAIAGPQGASCRQPRGRLGGWVTMGQAQSWAGVDEVLQL